MRKPIIKDYCKPFAFDEGNKDLVSFDSKQYARDAAKYIEYLEGRNKALVMAVRGLLSVDDFDINHANKVTFYAEQIIKGE